MSLFRTFTNTGDFAPLFRLLDDYDVHRQTKGQTSSIRSWSPRFDVRESTDAYHLDGELPGLAQQDISIEFTDPQTLVIKGRVERESHSEPAPQEPEASENSNNSNKEVAQTTKSERKHKYWVTERSVGEFHRAFSFPGRVDQDNVKASLANGILSIVVPKADPKSGLKKISIE
ncbi:hypothetical protein ASPZODRAFT_18624 [Penicilliopsis zonata CBS 506.65]|uniref:SHSP domain-containing protein n=1 Tax=Penicilliopsis zonata CBS 506.65 TaxID=1073090 RepID=A0A1L9SB84_9EURO|nr:hypothetical protein ASPZODRAFT_18624 [Penicilliopsis zonata CBS 506.65]OJJ44433.1 hypothetical protein ASPZODRAFT_18624 [Penicilliopsis zonata CBS 506.65]